jgi:hypothetical protein
MYTETSSPRTLKIMPKNFNEIIRIYECGFPDRATSARKVSEIQHLKGYRHGVFYIINIAFLFVIYVKLQNNKNQTYLSMSPGILL